MRSVYATEAGFWVLPDMRMGLGYNFTAAKNLPARPFRRVAGFTLPSFQSCRTCSNLFGTAKAGLAATENPVRKKG